MEKEYLPIKATKEIDSKINELISEHINLHTCQILEKGGPLGFEPFGSGVFVKKSGVYYILTASHVLTPLIDNTKDLYINAIGKRLPILGDIEVSEIEKSENLDIGFIRLPNAIGLELEKSLTPLDFYKNLQPHFDIMPKSPQYCVLGYPIKNIKIEDNKVKTGSSYYLLEPTKEETCRKLSISLDEFLVLNYRGKGLDMATRKLDKTERFHNGMSGGGVWFIYVWESEGKLNLDYQLIGIFIERRTVKFDLMIGNRLHRLVDRIFETENETNEPTS